MKHYSIYHLETGALIGRVFGCDISDPAALAHAVRSNTPDGHGVVEGRHDHLSKRVDVERLAREDSDALTAWDRSGERPKAPVATAAHVVDYVPPQPSSDHEWDAVAKRWRLTQAAQEIEQRKHREVAEIANLREQAHDPMMRLALDPADAAARQELLDIKARIAALQAPRVQVVDIKANQEPRKDPR